MMPQSPEPPLKIWIIRRLVLLFALAFGLMWLPLPRLFRVALALLAFAALLTFARQGWNKHQAPTRNR